MKAECSSKKVAFNEINVGSCFIFHGNLWMKTTSPAGGDISNAVAIENGIMTSFSDDDMVLPCKAKIVYEKE